jgi:hypothetical protein
VESAVAEEIAGLPSEQPSLAATALALARGLDNSAFTASHPSLARELVKILDACHRAAARGGRRLAPVSALARHR